MTFGSLFTGCGCADIGLERAGLTLLWGCEIAAHPASVFRFHHPTVTVYPDITTFPARECEMPDIVWLSPPCQDLSVAGKQQGLSGARSGLFYNATDHLRTFRRRGWRGVAIMEQVPGLLSSHGGDDMRLVIQAFAGVGARGVGWRVLDSEHFGVPQRRRRIYFVVDFGDGAKSKILFEPDGLPGDSGQGRQSRAQAASDDAGSTGSRGQPEDSMTFGVRVSATIGTRGGGANEPARFGAIVRARQDPIVSSVAQPLDTDGHSQALVMRTAQTSSNGFGLSDKAHTLDRFGPESVFAGQSARSLTPLECERCQGLPDNYTRLGLDEGGREHEMPDTARYSMIGNGVTATVAEWIGRRL